MKTIKQTKPFKVASVSDNLNSFGLRGIILIALDGEAWECGVSYHYAKKKGDVVHVPDTGNTGRHFAALGFEIPSRLSDAPPAVVKEVWSTCSD